MEKQRVDAGESHTPNLRNGVVDKIKRERNDSREHRLLGEKGDNGRELLGNYVTEPPIVRGARLDKFVESRQITFSRLLAEHLEKVVQVRYDSNSNFLAVPQKELEDFQKICSEKEA